MSKARRLLVSGLLAAAAVAQIHAAVAQSSTSPSFPRLGGTFVAGGSMGVGFGTPAYQAQIAKLGAAVIGIWPGWSYGGFNAQSAAAAIKAINPNIKLVLYTNIMELEAGVGSSGSAYSPIYNAANTNNWFLRTSWPSGSITDADGLSQDGLNQTNNAYLTWRAAWTAANEYLGSNWDGVFLDNVFYQPRVSADYNQSGSSQSASAAAQNWRNGYVAYVGYLRAALPAGKQVWGNVADWAEGSISGYNQLLNGGVMEGTIGESYSLENTSWAAMMNFYKIVMNALPPSNYMIFDQVGTVTDYQGMRYGLTSCLMDNAHYYFNDGSNYNVIWFDEFNFNLGAAIAGPNNPSNGTYSSGGLTIWKQGVYRRDFQNGIALVNPKGNGTQTVTLETTYKQLSGTQAPSVNNGQTVTSVTLNDRDGVILQRLTSQPVPDAPSLSVQ